MRNLALAVIALFTVIQMASAQPIATRATTLSWENTNPWTETSNFVFTAFASSGGAQVGKATAVTNSVPLISIMGSAVNGTYFLNGIATGTSGLTSDPSTNLTFQWFGTIAIQTQPQSLTVKTGDPATFTVTTIGGAGIVTYQWAKDGSTIPGATSQTLTIASAKTTDNGTYTVACSDTTGTARTQPATLFVIPKPNAPISLKLTP